MLNSAISEKDNLKDNVHTAFVSFVAPNWTMDVTKI